MAQYTIPDTTTECSLSHCDFNRDGLCSRPLTNRAAVNAACHAVPAKSLLNHLGVWPAAMS